MTDDDAPVLLGRGHSRKLPPGWTHPIQPSEVPTLFPGAKGIYWYGRPRGWQKGVRPAIDVYWSPGGMSPKPVLIVWAVPSEFRTRIRKWIEEVVSPSATAWLAGVDTRTETWRGFTQSKRWNWISPD